MGIGRKEDWEKRASKVTLKCDSHQLGWKVDRERMLHLSKDEDDWPPHSNWFLEQDIDMLRVALNSLKEEKADPSHGTMNPHLGQMKEEPKQQPQALPTRATEAATVAKAAVTPG